MTTAVVNHVVEGPDTAPALLLINSLGSTLEMWRPIMPELCRRFRVIRYDQRGHGASPVLAGPYSVEDLAGDALALLDKLGIARAHVCGTSLGGMVGLWLAVNTKQRVDRLALICSSPKLGPPEAWHERAALVRAQGTSAVAPTIVSRWFTPAFAAREPALIEHMIAMIAGTPAEGYAACCEAISRWDITGQLSQIEAPTWVMAAENDPSIPRSHAYLMGALIPGARVDVIPHAAHLAVCERPALVGRLLIEHMEGPAAVGTATAVERGESVRRAVLGDAHVDRAQANTTDFTAPFQDFITRYAWGEIWSRPGLSRAERSIVTLSILAALHHDEELGMHLRAALRNGLTLEQIREVLLQVGVYAGVPAANRAFAVAQRTLRELADSESKL